MLSAMLGPSSKVSAMLRLEAMGANSSTQRVTHAKIAWRRSGTIVPGIGGMLPSECSLRGGWHAYDRRSARYRQVYDSVHPGSVKIGQGDVNLHVRVLEAAP